MTDQLELDHDKLYFIPLGGSEEFGCNLNLYAYKGKYLLIDCGIGFPDHRFPLVDILLPDPALIEESKKDIVGLIVTHAHEDHIGAVSYLWNRLKCPLYATDFTANILRKKLSEKSENKEAVVFNIVPGEPVDLGPFSLNFISVAHSVPQAVSVVIGTNMGRVLHSGDWNLDPSPVLGHRTDENTFKKVGKEGVLAYIGDSTNAATPGRSGSEADVEQGIQALFKEVKGRIAVTMFSSNISRIQSICRAARETDRSVCVIGRSLHRMIGAARENGFLNDVPDFIPDSDLKLLPPEHTVLIVTGSQGEHRAALSRIARGDWNGLRLGKGDTVVYSSREIPGNEKDINAVRNNLTASGVHVITQNETPHKIHVSGHPYQDEIKDMYSWVNPKTVIAVHGEATQLHAQGELATACGIDNVIVPNNGSVIQLAPGRPEIVDHVPSALLAVEPGRVIRADHRSISQRRKLQYTGAVHISIAVDFRGNLLSDPKIDTIGLIDPEMDDEEDFIKGIMDEIDDILVDISVEYRMEDHFLSEEIRIGVRRYLQHMMAIKPKVTVHVMRIE